MDKIIDECSEFTGCSIITNKNNQITQSFFLAKVLNYRVIVNTRTQTQHFSYISYTLAKACGVRDNQMVQMPTHLHRSDIEVFAPKFQRNTLSLQMGRKSWKYYLWPLIVKDAKYDVILGNLFLINNWAATGIEPKQLCMLDDDVNLFQLSELLPPQMGDFKFTQEGPIAIAPAYVRDCDHLIPPNSATSIEISIPAIHDRQMPPGFAWFQTCNHYYHVDQDRQLINIPFNGNVIVHLTNQTAHPFIIHRDTRIGVITKDISKMEEETENERASDIPTLRIRETLTKPKSREKWITTKPDEDKLRNIALAARERLLRKKTNPIPQINLAETVKSRMNDFNRAVQPPKRLEKLPIPPMINTPPLPPLQQRPTWIENNEMPNNPRINEMLTTSDQSANNNIEARSITTSEWDMEIDHERTTAENNRHLPATITSENAEDVPTWRHWKHGKIPKIPELKRKPVSLPRPIPQCFYPPNYDHAQALRRQRQLTMPFGLPTTPITTTNTTNPHPYTGFVIENGCLGITQALVDRMMHWPVIETPSELKEFVRVMEHFNRFIPKFARCLAVLKEVAKKATPLQEYRHKVFTNEENNAIAQAKKSC